MEFQENRSTFELGASVRKRLAKSTSVRRTFSVSEWAANQLAEGARHFDSNVKELLESVSFAVSDDTSGQGIESLREEVDKLPSKIQFREPKTLVLSEESFKRIEQLADRLEVSRDLILEGFAGLLFRQVRVERLNEQEALLELKRRRPELESLVADYDTMRGKLGLGGPVILDIYFNDVWPEEDERLETLTEELQDMRSRKEFEKIRDDLSEMVI